MKKLDQDPLSDPVTVALNLVSETAAAIRQSEEQIGPCAPALAVREAELATSTGRADEAEAGMQKVVDAIRTHLPVKLSVPTE